MSLLYDKLYQSQVYKELSVKNYLGPLIDDIITNFPNIRNIQIETDLQDFILDVDRLQPLGIIINELSTNIMKYAFVGRVGGHIAVSSICNKGHVLVMLQDDGNGIPESVSFENSTGFGLQLVHALAQKLDGSIRLERGNGTKFVLEF